MIRNSQLMDEANPLSLTAFFILLLCFSTRVFPMPLVHCLCCPTQVQPYVRPGDRRLSLCCTSPGYSTSPFAYTTGDRRFIICLRLTVQHASPQSDMVLGGSGRHQVRHGQSHLPPRDRAVRCPLNTKMHTRKVVVATRWP
ncbi:uncharacterized protein IWZ02DRAFT_463528 [Phyllosticta citriasiana]|uniref:uncharacterized protein n=1 Tax=Phyllosticta citriasiana TaxID=595635 RepID=UPI0030FDCE59